MFSISKKTVLALILFSIPTVISAGEYFYIADGERDLGHIELDITKEGFPCFDRERLLEWKIITPENMGELKEIGCINNKELYPLNISANLIEKINILTFIRLEPTEVKNDPRLAISNRDDGIPAILINYDANYQRYEGLRYARRKIKDNIEFELESGINLKKWRLRAKQYHNNEDMPQKRVKFSDIYLERDISAINSRLHMGDGYNNSFYLDSFPYRGIKLASDDNMFPSSQGAVLPWVYGVALTDAEVEVIQNGMTVYRTMVSPGDFVLRNIKLFDKSGFISMIVKESDGTSSYYDVPWNQLENLIDKDTWKYDISFGKFMSDSRMEESHPLFFQGGFGYGISTQNSLYGGALVSEGYYNHSFGIGQRLGQYGDVVLNHRVSKITSSEQGEVKGEKLRLQYSANFNKLNTSITANGDYFLQPHYNDFNNYANSAKSGYFCCDFYKKEYSYELSLQSLISPSQNLSFNINHEKYRGEQGKSTFYALTFTQSASLLSFDLDLAYNRYSTHKGEMRFDITFRIPLAKTGIKNTSVNLGYSYNPYDHYQKEISINGRKLDNNLNYQVAAQSGKKSKKTYRANARYRYAAGESGIRYISGTDYTRYSANSSGSLVFHSAGMTAGQTLGDTNALVYAKNHPDTELPDQMDVITNKRGYAIITGLIPYQVNAVSDEFAERDIFDDEPENEVVKVPTLGALSYYELVN
ncbi:fimbria/pilus outer membrane usher protein [Erwinia sorbitola]|uniref:Fimbria/pilus outer membrane usher protein n=1 Tax=Erwinia sorbitola TaxID=2681984 RepID=A0A6I6EIS5_9GAMM|nr:fimbria/pilus outer membrane usher protein [Erwinia sorbitola]QGU89817.1 fimbria/pilus outer membrane usher protein [Erwinia sorbitola]